jgi:hypothetical protein
MQVSLNASDLQSSQSKLRDFVPPKCANSLHIASLASRSNEGKFLDAGGANLGELVRLDKFSVKL